MAGQTLGITARLVTRESTEEQAGLAAGEQQRKSSQG
jgi:hypothetical protein